MPFAVNLKHLDDEVFSTFMDRKMKTLRYLMLGLASATLLAACGDGNDDSFDDRADIADPKPRFVHAAPAAPAFTLVRNGAPASNATGAAYKYASPPRWTPSAATSTRWSRCPAARLRSCC